MMARCHGICGSAGEVIGGKNLPSARAGGGQEEEDRGGERRVGSWQGPREFPISGYHRAARSVFAAHAARVL